MKRFLLLAALVAVISASAAGRATELLEKLAAGFRAMPGYGVSFAVAAGDQTVRGGYTVSGESYYLRMGDAEVFCDGKTRYEVDNRRREVTVSGVDTSSRNILNNPAHAFDFLGSEYTPTLLWERDGKAAVRLTPAGKGNAASGNVTVTISTATMRPQSLEYDYDGEHVGIAVGEISPLSTPVKSFTRAEYPGYEFIDFR